MVSTEAQSAEKFIFEGLALVASSPKKEQKRIWHDILTRYPWHENISAQLV